MAGKGGGGAWKVAYADFATAMMAFFLVMWITQQNKAVKDSVAQYFENPLGTHTEARASSVHGIPGASADAELPGEQAGPHGSPTREKGTFVPSGPDDEPNPDARPHLHIFDKLDNMRSIGTMVLFPDDSVELNRDAQEQLNALADELRGKPHKVEVRGHAVRIRPTVDEISASRWDLCYARSINTMKFLITCGIEPHRFRLSQDGTFEPYDDQGNPIIDPRNGRVEVSAVDELIFEYKPALNRRAGDFIPAPSQADDGTSSGESPPANREDQGKPAPGKPAGARQSPSPKAAHGKPGH